MIAMFLGLALIVLGLGNGLIHGSVQLGLIALGSFFVAVSVFMFFYKKRKSTRGNVLRKSEKEAKAFQQHREMQKKAIAQYKDFVRNVCICTEHKRINGDMKTICIHKETKELFCFISKPIENNSCCFSSAPKRITSYSQLLAYMDADAKAFFKDLNKSNWKNYFEFMLVKPESDGEVIKKQLLSRDSHVVYLVSNMIIRLALAEPSERKELLKPSFESLSLIKKNAKSLRLGGAFASNNRFLSRALAIIEGNETDNCFCRMALDEFSGDADSIAKHYGFILVQPSDATDDPYVLRGIIQCPVCHKKYSVREEYTGWHIATRTSYCVIK